MGPSRFMPLINNTIRNITHKEYRDRRKIIKKPVLMEHMKNNIHALCLVVLLMMSSTLWSCQATTINKGTLFVYVYNSPIMYDVCSQLGYSYNLNLCNLYCIS